MAMMAAYSGCLARTVAAERGILTWEHIKPVISAKIYYRAQTALVCLENTHNMAGGTVTPLPVLEGVWAGAHEAGLPVHLDGARVFNAATALGTTVAKLTSGFDTVMFCLSKGLGAPVGSMLVGSKKAIEQARVYRKALGGGMRQAGVLAAAGLIALHEMPKRLSEDHANARLLADAVAANSKAAEIDLEAVQTNIVIFKLNGKDQSSGGDAAAFTAALKEKGVLVSAIGPHSVRFVTHYDVDNAACKKAAGIVSEQLKSMSA
jgi:threonine aldolase